MLTIGKGPTYLASIFSPGNGHRVVIDEARARLMTARNWSVYQRCEVLRVWCIRVAWIALIAVGILIWELA